MSSTGIIYEHHPNGTHLFRFSDTRRETVDQWQMLMQTTIDGTPPDGHFRVLVDVHGLWISPHTMRVAGAISRYSPHELPASTAVVMNDSLGMSLAQTLFNQLSEHGHRARRVFTSEAEALDWLEKRDRQFSHTDHRLTE